MTPPEPYAGPDPGQANGEPHGRDAGRSRGGDRLGRYRLIEPLGAGAFATVWRAVDDELMIDVAVKVLADNWSLNADVRARFLAEARLLRRIESPNVVRVHDVGVAGERPYFVMDLVTGGTIADIPDDVPARSRLLLAAQCAYAVHEVHRAGVAHRDIKPSNILLDTTGHEPRVVVADLGTAKLLADGSGFTMTAGTPAYMAPEQALGAGIDARCDVYSLAVVTYEMLSGRLPRSTPGLPYEHTAPERIAAGLGVPAALDTVLQDALAADPAKRPVDAAALARRLEAVADDADPDPSAEWPVWLVLGLALAIAVVVAAGVWWLI